MSSAGSRNNLRGKYRLVAELGRGGMAVVYLAVAQGVAGVHKLLVIKELLPEYSQNARFVQMFLTEARLAARMHHPNIVQTLDIVQEDGHYFIVMEYLSGHSLDAILLRSAKKNIPLPPWFALRVVSETLTALQYMHTLADYRGTPLLVVHRDVTPHNLFVTYDGAVKLVDFGVAQSATSPDAEPSVVGKVHYMAPEQARADVVDLRADIFSVGVIVWETATGSRLWKGMKPEEIAAVLVSGRPIPSVRTVNPDVLPVFEAICKRALALDPRQRYASCAEMQADIDVSVAQQGGAGTSAKDLGRIVSDLFSGPRARAEAAIHERLHQLEMHGYEDVTADGLDKIIAARSMVKAATPDAALARERAPSPAPHGSAPRFGTGWSKAEPTPVTDLRKVAAPLTGPVMPTPAPEGAALAAPPKGLVADILGRLVALPNVVSASAFDPNGRCLGALPAGQAVGQNRNLMECLGTCFDLVGSVESGPMAKRAMAVSYEAGLLLVRRTEAGTIALFASSRTSAQPLGVGLNAAMLKLKDVPVSAPGSSTPPAVERVAAEQPVPSGPVVPLKALTEAFARHVGPLAAVVVKRALSELGASHKTVSAAQIPSLIEVLCRSIDDAKARSQFVEEARKATRT